MRQAAVLASSCAAIVLTVFAVSHAPVASSGRRQEPAGTKSATASHMDHHFELVTAVHDAVIRGDLPGARNHARALANRPDPAGMPASAEPYLVGLRRAAGRAANADRPDDVAAASAAMLAACGDCHRAAGTMPAMPPPAAPGVGGLVGHMLEHKRAADLMVQGLTVPSASLWQEGVQALDRAPLRRGDLPYDRKLTRAIAAEEKRVHELVARAREAADQRSRIYVYSELMQSCGACHALHGGVWGPDRQ